MTDFMRSLKYEVPCCNFPEHIKKDIRVTLFSSTVGILIY